jgi:NAD(P)H-hydrate epimerase
MKLFRSDQIKQIDEHTIKEEPVASIDLMERAAGQILIWYIQRFDRSKRIFIFAGPGNNGGDGLALARMLKSNRYEPVVCYIEFTEKTTEDWKTNLLRLNKESNVEIVYVKGTDQIPVISNSDVIIDAIFGTGLTRPAGGLAGDVIRFINLSGEAIISVDIPSGLFGEDNSSNNYETIISADFTLSFQFPKL